jgi:hypothetical protein
MKVPAALRFFVLAASSSGMEWLTNSAADATVEREDLFLPKSLTLHQGQTQDRDHDHGHRGHPTHRAKPAQGRGDRGEPGGVECGRPTDDEDEWRPSRLITAVW